MCSHLVHDESPLIGAGSENISILHDDYKSGMTSTRRV